MTICRERNIRQAAATLAAGISLVLVVGQASAATFIEERDGESITQMWIDAGRMRVQAPGEPGYSLMNLSKKTMFMVDPSQKHAVDMSAMVFGKMPAASQGTPSAASGTLKRVGDGPKIAGYATEHYVVEAGGQVCEELYVSKQAFKDAGWGELWADAGRAFKEMAAAGEGLDECDLAGAQAVDPAKIGWPLKTVYPDGEFNEVTRIQKDAPLPPGGLDVPAGYTVISMQQMMQEAMSGREDD